MEGKKENKAATHLCGQGCIYWRPIHSRNGRNACHYLVDTGEPRNSPPEVCGKFTRGQGGKG